MKLVQTKPHIAWVILVSTPWSLLTSAEVLIGFWASRALLLLAKDAVAFGQVTNVRLDSRVLAFTLAVTMLTAVLFRLIPA